MKYIKTGLVVAVLGIIVFFVYQSNSGSGRDDNDETTIVEQPNNQFAKKIFKEIDSLNNLPKRQSSIGCYGKIQGDLETFYHHGNLGTDSIQNKQEFENLSKTLFATYVPKFVHEAFYTFEQPIWKSAKIRVIKNQVTAIKNSHYFDAKNSKYNADLKEINKIISQYYKVAAFVGRCRRYPTNLNYAPDSHFPTNGVKRKINKAKRYLNHHLGNKYVNNVSWLKSALREVPRKMYRKNFKFLKRQIQENSNRYEDFETHADYLKHIYLPIDDNLNRFDYEMYGVPYNPTFKNDYQKLKNLLNLDNKRAAVYYKDKQIREIY